MPEIMASCNLYIPSPSDDYRSPQDSNKINNMLVWLGLECIDEWLMTGVHTKRTSLSKDV